MASTIIAPAALCGTCLNGCDCRAALAPGCGHYGCWGAEPSYDCPGLSAVETHRHPVDGALPASVRYWTSMGRHYGLRRTDVSLREIAEFVQAERRARSGK